MIYFSSKINSLPVWYKIYLSGTRLLDYLSGTRLIVYLSGTRLLVYLSGTILTVYLSGTRLTVYLSGTRLPVYLSGTRFPSASDTVTTFGLERDKVFLMSKLGKKGLKPKM